MYISKINDQEAGCVSTIVSSLDDLPLLKSSIRQDLMKNTKKFRDNILDFSNLANQKLEGWLDDNNYENIESKESNFKSIYSEDDLMFEREYNESNIYYNEEGDPWI